MIRIINSSLFEYFTSFEDNYTGVSTYNNYIDLALKFKDTLKDSDHLLSLEELLNIPIPFMGGGKDVYHSIYIVID